MKILKTVDTTPKPAQGNKPEEIAWQARKQWENAGGKK